MPSGPMGTAPTPGITYTGAAAGATRGKPKIVKAASPQASQSTSSMPEVGWPSAPVVVIVVLAVTVEASTSVVEISVGVMVVAPAAATPVDGEAGELVVPPTGTPVPNGALEAVELTPEMGVGVASGRGTLSPLIEELFAGSGGAGLPVPSGIGKLVPPTRVENEDDCTGVYCAEVAFADGEPKATPVPPRIDSTVGEEDVLGDAVMFRLRATDEELEEEEDVDEELVDEEVL